MDNKFWCSVDDTSIIKAMKLPPGKKLLVSAGTDLDTNVLLQFARKQPDFNESATVVCADSVELEWWQNDTKRDWSKNYRLSRYVVLIDA